MGGEPTNSNGGFKYPAVELANLNKEGQYTVIEKVL